MRLGFSRVQGQRWTRLCVVCCRFPAAREIVHGPVAGGLPVVTRLQQETVGNDERTVQDSAPACQVAGTRMPLVRLILPPLCGDRGRVLALFKHFALTSSVHGLRVGVFAYAPPVVCLRFSCSGPRD